MNEKRFIEAKVLEKKAEGVFLAVASSGREDRHGEVVDQDGWDIKNFKKAPRLLWAHDHRIPAIGKATKIWIEGKGKSAKLMFEGVFHEITDLGRAAKQLFEEGYVDTFSVGFMPIEMEGNTFTKQELLEISLVNVPANADAMAKAYKSLKDSGYEDEVATQLGFPVAVLDKLESMDKDIQDIRKELSVKGQPSPAPKAHSTNTRKNLSSLKLIAKATDKLLVGEKKGIDSKERVDNVKIIKRASEILIAKEKGKL